MSVIRFEILTALQRCLHQLTNHFPNTVPRIENLLESQYVNPAHNKESEEDEAGSMSTDKKYLCFKRLTQIPIQKNLIDVSLLTKKEVDWLDAYHQEVFDKVSPLLEEGSPALEWLTKSTSPMERL